MRPLKLISSSAVMVALCTMLAGGCGGSPQHDEQLPTDPQSGGLDSAPGENPDSNADGKGAGGGDNGNAGGIAQDPSKATICHIPPGNPANAHTIVVGLPAVKAHLKHGDTLGACGSDGGTGGGEVDAGTGGGEVDAGTGGGDVDAGPACAPAGDTCGGGVVCCDGLTCSSEGYCEPIIG